MMMKPKPTRGTTAGSAYLDLQRTGRQYGRSTAEMLELYALEGFLDRLASSRYAGKFILKGGVLLAAYEARRPTRDVDFLARSLSGEMGQMLAVVREIAQIVIDDGLVYDTASAKVQTIRDAGIYPGVRVTLTAALFTAQLAFHVDINLGDPVWPGPQAITLPRLLGGAISVTGYPLVMVFAEKIVTCVQKLKVNTRWRDFADIRNLSRHHDVSGRDLSEAVRTVAGHQQVTIAPLSEILAGFAPIAQVRWASWRRHQSLEDSLPADFASVLAEVIAFADPVLTGGAAGKRWSAMAREWGR
jgi:Nucleotidyl transferase AbiEii toxin, Type IV TA system